MVHRVGYSITHSELVCQSFFFYLDTRILEKVVTSLLLTLQDRLANSTAVAIKAIKSIESGEFLSVDYQIGVDNPSHAICMCGSQARSI